MEIEINKQKNIRSAGLLSYLFGVFHLGASGKIDQQPSNKKTVIMGGQPTPLGHVPPLRNKGLTAGLIKGNHWLISP